MRELETGKRYTIARREGIVRALWGVSGVIIETYPHSEGKRFLEFDAPVNVIPHSEMHGLWVSPEDVEWHG